MVTLKGVSIQDLILAFYTTNAPNTACVALR